MKTILIIAGIAAFAVAAPASAKPHGDHGDRSERDQGDQGDRGDRGRWNNSYGYDNDHRGHCPPGLAKKHNGCLPPGQYAKRFGRGDRFNSNYGQRYGYNQLPYSVRRQYNLDRSNRYYYDQGYLYQVDPRTNIVEQVIRTLLGGR